VTEAGSASSVRVRVRDRHDAKSHAWTGQGWAANVGCLGGAVGSGRRGIRSKAECGQGRGTAKPTGRLGKNEMRSVADRWAKRRGCGFSLVGQIGFAGPAR
jgi:hypothetical protein